MNILELLDRPIAFHRWLVKPCGSINAALMLSQALYWTKRLPPDRDGWFWKTIEEWEDETGLTRREQEGARALLKQRNLLEEKLSGVPARLSFRAVQTSLHETAKLDCTKPPNKFAPNRQTSLSTETTSEITAETTKEPVFVSGPLVEIVKPNKANRSPSSKDGSLPIFVLRSKLNALFKRADSSLWGNAEEHYLVDIVKRPDCLAEMAEIERFFAKGSFCPQSVKSLLEHWTETLDRARNHETNQKRNANNPKAGQQISIANRGTLNERGGSDFKGAAQRIMERRDREREDARRAAAGENGEGINPIPG